MLLSIQAGTYVVHFRTPRSTGSGVAVVSGDGQIEGGDSGFRYRGHLSENGDRVRAKVIVSQHTAGHVSVFGNSGEFELDLEGSRTSRGFELKGGIPSAPGIPFSLSAQLS